MRRRSLFVRHTTLVAALRLLPPLVVASGLAVAGHAATAHARPVRPVAAAPAVDLPERAHPQVRHAVVTRASRSGTRRARGWVRPAYGPLTSPFGYRWGKLHEGVDIGASYGAPIYAAAAGVVTYVGPEAGYGRLVLIRHADGTVTAYGHMSRYATRVGKRVLAGDLIAYVGSAGDATGPHLHFEVRVGGRPVNPIPYLRARGVRL